MDRKVTPVKKINRNKNDDVQVVTYTDIKKKTDSLFSSILDTEISKIKENEADNEREV